MCRLAMSKALPLRVCRVLSAFCKAPQVGRNSTVLRTQLSMSTGLLPSCAALAWMARLRGTSGRRRDVEADAGDRGAGLGQQHFLVGVQALVPGGLAAGRLSGGGPGR